MDFEEVATKSGDQSSVWHYFLRAKDKNNAKCKLCQKILKCVGGSTGGLIKHIKNVHHKSLTTVTEEPVSQIIDNPVDRIPKKKLKITDYYESEANPSMEVMISRMAAKDGCPFRTFAESKDLRKLFQNSGHNLPKSATAIKNIVIKQADKKKKSLIDEIQRLLKDNHKFSISFDEWTSIRNRRYTSLNLHSKHFSGNNNFKNLGLIRIYGSLPAKKCVEEIRLKLEEFGVSLEKDIVAETTDGCSMMTKFGKMLKSCHQKCIAHALQLAINDVFYTKNIEEIPAAPVESDDEDDDLPISELARRYNNNMNDVNGRSDNDTDDETDSLQVENSRPSPSRHIEQQFEYQDLLKKVKTVVKLFRKSPTKNDDILQKYVVADFNKEYSLTNDCKTRWGSLANTLERFLKLRTCIVKALIDIRSDITFTEDDWTTMKQLYEVLDIIKAVLEALCRRDATLLTADVAVKFGLKKLSAINTYISTKMTTYLKQRYSARRLTETTVLKYLHNPEVYFTTVQDDVFPRPDSDEMRSHIVELLTRTNSVSLMAVHPPEEPSQNQENNDLHRDAILTKKDELNTEILNATKNVRVRSDQEDLDSTIRIEMALFENGGDRGRFLSLAYDHLLTIPPTSVEPERIFSAAGLLCNKIRSRLSDKSLDALIFLRTHYNEQDSTK